MSSRIVILTGQTVDHLVKHCLTTADLLANQASVFCTLDSGNGGEDPADAGFEAPHRTTLSLSRATMLFMPARLADAATCKVVSVPKQGSGLFATTTVLDGKTGQLKAIVNATALTALRTAAGSALASLALHPLTRYGAASSQPRRITLFGSGQQALHHALLFSSIYSSKSLAFDFIARSPLPSSTLKELQGSTIPPDAITAILASDCDKVERSVSQTDIIICCTPSHQPLFRSKWVQSGTHIVLVGSCEWAGLSGRLHYSLVRLADKPFMQEVEVELVHRARGRIIVDDSDACASEAGDLIKAGVDSHDCIPLGALLRDDAFARLVSGQTDSLPSSQQLLSSLARLNRTQRQDATTADVSLFKSVGVGLQDAAVTSLIVDKASEHGVGAQMDF